MLISSWKSWIIDTTDKRWDSWFLVMWKTIWHLSGTDSLGGQPDPTLLRDVFCFLRFPSVHFGILVMWKIFEREYWPPWIKLKALLLHLGVYSWVSMMWLMNYQRIEALFILVVMIIAFVRSGVSSKFVIVSALSADHCSFRIVLFNLINIR